MHNTGKGSWVLYDQLYKLYLRRTGNNWNFRVSKKLANAMRFRSFVRAQNASYRVDDPYRFEPEQLTAAQLAELA